MSASSENDVIRLSRSLNGAYLPDLCEALDGLRGGDAKLDASDVEHVGALCLQVLISARRTWKAEHHSLEILAASDEFIRDINLLGCQDPIFDMEEQSE